MEAKKLNRDIIKERFDIEFTDDNYRLAFRDLIKRVYGDNSVGSSLILEEVFVDWDEFVTSLVDGYEMSSYEFDNDIDSYRGILDSLAGDKKLNSFDEHSKAIKLLETIDQRFKELTIEINDYSTRDKWWRRRILRTAGDEYFDTLGIDLSDLKIVRQ